MFLGLSGGVMKKNMHEPKDPWYGPKTVHPFKKFPLYEHRW
jgi:hypothetical protein